MTCSWWRARPATAGLMVAVVVGVSGCAGNKGDVSQGDYDKAANNGAKLASSAAKPDAKGEDFSEMPTPPAGAEYTIYCQTYSGENHQQIARQTRDFLRHNTPMGSWYVIHGEQQSTLYYGFYRTIDKRDASDGAEGQRAIDDLDRIRTIHSSSGARWFPGSLPVSISTPDPTANPKWDLTRSGGYWSLCIASFADIPDRKQRAVEAVAEARKNGVQAYYYHGPRSSDVCVGAWPRAAALEIDTASQNADPSRSLLVTQTPLDPSMKEKLDPNVQAVAPQVDPVDPSMIQALSQYTEHAVNGSVRYQPDPSNPAVASKVPIDRSFLVKIPAPANGADGRLPTATSDTETSVAPLTGSTSSGGKLNSLDDK